MAGKWEVLVPGAATNLVTNPSVETATTGWTATGGSVARSNAYAHRGIYSLAWTPDAATTDSAIYNSFTLVSGTTYTISIWGRWVNGIPYLIQFYRSGLKGTATAFTGAGAWERKEVTFQADASAAFSLFVGKNNNASTAVVYLDCAQVEAASAATSYIDGDQPGCYWSGTHHASSSVRKANSRDGGTWTSLDSLGVYVLGEQGLGLMPPSLDVQEYAVRDGGEVRQSRTPTRGWGMAADIIGTSLSDLISKRQTFGNYIRNDRYSGLDYVWFRYTGATNDVLVKAFYVGGLEQARLAPDGFSERVSLQFVSDKPALWRETQGIASLDYTDELTNVAFLGRINGQWTDLGDVSASGGLTSLAEMPNGSIVVAGAFSSIGGVAASNIAVFTGSTFTTLGAGVNNQVQCVAVSPASVIYAGGYFTQAGGNTAYRIASCTGTTWSAMATGFNGLVNVILPVSDGTIWEGGTHTTNGLGAGTFRQISKWNGTSWTEVNGGFNSGVYTLLERSNGNVIAGGALTTSGVTSLAYIAENNGTAWSALNDGMDNWVYDVAEVGGRVWAVGLFSEADGQVVNGTAVYNGTGWSSFEESLDFSTVFSPYVIKHRAGLFHIGGAFEQTASGVPASKYAVYNGTSWLNPDISGIAADVMDILLKNESDVYLALSVSEAALTVAHVNTVTNSGSGDVYPKLTIVGDNTDTLVRWLENQTTGDILYLNIDVLNDEVITLDFEQATITSSFGRNMNATILPGSDFANFQLVTGANSIAAFATSSGTPLMILTWQERDTGV